MRIFCDAVFFLLPNPTPAPHTRSESANIIRSESNSLAPPYELPARDFVVARVFF
jgi:hypothetical protein